MNPRIMTAALALATVMTMMPPRAAEAAPYWPWCSRRYDYFSDMYTCAFASWEQCMETMRGIGGLCYANPYRAPPSPAPGRLAKPRRHAARS